eukprot:Gb_08181 [translate_table: standard]
MDFKTAIKLENSLSSNAVGEVYSIPEVNGCRELIIVKEEPYEEPSFMHERARVDPLQQAWNECFPTNSSNPCEPSQYVQRNLVESDLTVFRRPRKGRLIRRATIADAPPLPSGWSRCIHFFLAIVNHNDHKLFVKKASGIDGPVQKGLTKLLYGDLGCPTHLECLSFYVSFE